MKYYSTYTTPSTKINNSKVIFLFINMSPPIGLQKLRNIHGKS